MTKISMISSSSDLDNKELFPVSSSSYLKVWSSWDSGIEEEENIDTDDPESIDSDILVSLSYLLCNIWQKIQIHINTNFAVTGCVLCVIPHILKDAKYHSYSDHRKKFNNVIKTLFPGLPEDEIAVTKDIFWTE